MTLSTHSTRYPSVGHSPARMSRAIIHRRYGQPHEVLELRRTTVESPGPEQVLIRSRFAPINHATINMIEGRYVTLPELPCVLGNEGVGTVEVAGTKVCGVEPGDAVILPRKRADGWVGQWAEYYVADQSQVMKVPTGFELEQAAMLTVNPPTAYLLLRNFADLQPGDWVAQNLANSALGRCVIFMAKAMGYRTINVVRRAEHVDELLALGADEVVVEGGDLRGRMRQHRASVKLALNGVGGDSARGIARVLGHGGVMVTYGAMSKSPVTISNSALIFKNIQLCGFNRSNWVRGSSREDVERVYAEVFELLRGAPFAIPVQEIIPFEEYRRGVALAQSEDRRGKVLLSF